MVQTDGTGRHNSVNLGLFSVKMPNLGAHFVLKENTYFLSSFLMLNICTVLHRQIYSDCCYYMNYVVSLE